MPEPLDADAIVAQAEKLRDLGKYRQAAETILAHYAWLHTRADALNVLGFAALLGDKNPKQALKYFEQCLALEPNEAFYMSHMYLAHSTAGNHDDALLWAKRALAAGPGHHALFEGKASAEFNVRNYRQALEDSESAIQISPGYAAAFYTKALSLERLDRKTEAESTARELLALDPEHAGAHYLLAKILAADNKNKEAIDHITAALRLDPQKIVYQELFSEVLRREMPAYGLVSRIVTAVGKIRPPIRTLLGAIAIFALVLVQSDLSAPSTSPMVFGLASFAAMALVLVFLARDSWSRLLLLSHPKARPLLGPLDIGAGAASVGIAVVSLLSACGLAYTDKVLASCVLMTGFVLLVGLNYFFKFLRGNKRLANIVLAAAIGLLILVVRGYYPALFDTEAAKIASMFAGAALWAIVYWFTRKADQNGPDEPDRTI